MGYLPFTPSIEEEKTLIHKIKEDPFKNYFKFMQVTKSILSDYVKLNESDSFSSFPLLRNYLLDKILITLVAEFEVKLEDIIRRFLEQRLQAGDDRLKEEMTLCILKHFQKRKEFNSIIGSIDSLFKKFPNIFCLDKSKSKLFKNQLKKNFHEKNKNIFIGYKNDRAIEEIFNYILATERNNIAHNLRSYGDSDHRLFYTLILTENFLQTFDDQLKTLLNT